MNARLRVLLVPDSIYWVTGTIAKSIAAANPDIESTIVSGPLLDELFDAAEIGRRFDIVHFICPYASRDWLPRLRDVVPVVTSHHHVTSWPLIRHNLDGDAIVAGSSEWVSDLHERGADMSRVFRVPYGVDVDLFKPAIDGQAAKIRKNLGLGDAGPVIGFFAKRASNDDDRKGTDVFVSAIMQLRKTLPRTGVLIVGPGWQELVGKFRAAGVACTWLPFIRNAAAVPPLYHALHFYWVTARVEGGPVPLLEAMSSEICCLSTKVGLAVEVIRDGVNGFLLPMNDPSAFAKKTEQLWAHPPQRERIARAGRQTMEAEMRSDEMARLVGAVYDRATENFNARQSHDRESVRSAERRVMSSDGIRRDALTPAEERRVRMLESLAWSENLVLYQNQKGAALRMIAGAWKENPKSLEPPRVFLRRFLPDGLVKGIVGLKHRAKRRSKKVGVAL
jgi:Glycosyltransferase